MKREWGGCTHVMHGRSRMTIDLRSPAMPERSSTSTFHRPGRHYLVEPREAASRRPSRCRCYARSELVHVWRRSSRLRPKLVWSYVRTRKERLSRYSCMVRICLVRCTYIAARLAVSHGPKLFGKIQPLEVRTCPARSNRWISAVLKEQRFDLVLRACLNLFRPGWNGANGTKLLVLVLFHSKLFVSILNFQATEQPTRTENNPADFCGGTAQLDPKTGVPSRGQRVLLT